MKKQDDSEVWLQGWITELKNGNQPTDESLQNAFEILHRSWGRKRNWVTKKNGAKEADAIDVVFEAFKTQADEMESAGEKAVFWKKICGEYKRVSDRHAKGAGTIQSRSDWVEGSFYRIAHDEMTKWQERWELEKQWSEVAPNTSKAAKNTLEITPTGMRQGLAICFLLEAAGFRFDIHGLKGKAAELVAFVTGQHITNARKVITTFSSDKANRQKGIDVVAISPLLESLSIESIKQSIKKISKFSN